MVRNIHWSNTADASQIKCFSKHYFLKQYYGIAIPSGKDKYSETSNINFSIAVQS